MFNNMTNSPWQSNGMNFRLTPISGVPIVDDLGGTVGTIYVTPYGGGDLISIYDLNVWKKMKVVDTGITVPAVADTVYDVFAEDAGLGVVAYTTVAWNTLTSRSVAVSLFQGVYTKTADTTKTYVGSFRTGNASQVSFNPLKRDIWNCYNRVEMPFFAIDTTNSWTLGASPISTYRQANANTSNKIRFLQGFSNDPIKARATTLYTYVGITGGYSGIGIDSTSVNSANIIGTQQDAIGVAGVTSVNCELNAFLTLPGSHELVWLEATDTAATVFYGDNNFPAFYQSGLIGSYLC